ncbi:hypothetical protein MACJ_000917 [Theileria orientalis]|uniref:Snurportin-1 n=1 Tax=Theileria orientalis TaxID=68886 RepID=A0A976M689_THEOR|nr:hypothetical protein MACJ_000917 [Theileria orientalis]
MEIKRPRALEDLREEFVEKRRKKYLENLESFTEFDNFEYSFNNTDFSIVSKVPLDSTLLDETSVNQTNINELLAFPEFITCLDSLISEEVAQIKESLFFVRPEGSRALIYIKNNFATVYNKEGIDSDEYEYQTDSIVFVNKHSIYVGGYNPNWLCYKDSVLNKYIESETVVCKLYNINNELYTFDRVFVGKSGEEFKEKIVRIVVTDFHDFKVSYRIVGEGKSYKNPDTLRKIYVNYANHKRTNTDFGKILKCL